MVKEHYQEINIKFSANALYRAFSKSGKKRIVIANIGTPKLIYDAIGPLIGSMLVKKRLNNIDIYGTLDDPIHALNVEKFAETIKPIQDDAFIIATDACLCGNIKNIGSIIIGNTPIRPGIGVNKKLPNIGDVSISAGVALTIDHEQHELSLTSCYLSDIYNYADVICDIIKELDDMIFFKSMEQD